MENTSISQYLFPGKLQMRSSCYWRVAAGNTSGQGQHSMIWSFNTGSVTPPDPPTLLAPPDSSVVSLFPVFDWTDVLGATSYRIQISANPMFSSTVLNISGLTNSAYVLASAVLTNNTKYYWRVNATNSGGTSPWSSVWRIITVPTVPPPPNLYPVNGGNPIYPDSSMIFKWSKVNTATSYRINIFYGPNILIDQVVSDTLYIAPPHTFSSNTTYYWRVASINVGGQGPWTSAWAFTTASSPPNPPILVFPLNNAINISLTPTLDWSDVPGAATYRVQVSTSQSFSNYILNVGRLSNSGYSVQSGILSYNTKYYWRVNASNVAGTSNWSDVWNFTTLNQIGINQISSEIPSEYKLYNNYPNPFNPTTSIKYSVLSIQNVKLVVYDVLGKEVKTLVNEKQSPGIYEVNFNARQSGSSTDLPSGIYFYTIRSGDFTDTKQMVLIK